MSCETCGAPSGWVDGHRLASANESKREAMCVQRQQTQRIATLEQQNAELVAALQMLADLHDASGMPQSAIRMNAAKAIAKVKQP